MREGDLMSQELWDAVDRYVSDTLVGHDGALEEALRASDAAGLPQIAVSPAQGKLLHLLARIRGARSVLEIGTLGGYSAIWLGRAIAPDGRMVTLELDAAHAAVARANLARAGLASVVEVRLGKALDTLPELAHERPAPFDLSFIDADKANIPEYFDWALRMSRPGSVIVVDNVVRKGAVIQADSEDESVRGVRRLNERLATEPRVSSTTIQTVGVKGYDGFTVSLVLS
jgi:predicted O-methyltransferase YrrM